MAGVNARHKGRANMKLCNGKDRKAVVIWSDGTGVAACGRTGSHKAHAFNGADKWTCQHDHKGCEFRLYGRCLTCESHQKRGCAA